MLNAFASYRQRKQSQINAKMANMRAAKERNRIARSESEPIRTDIDDSLEITVIRRISGIKIQEDKYLLINEEGRGTINQYDVWDVNTQEYMGLMGIYKIFLQAAKRFPRIRKGP